MAKTYVIYGLLGEDKAYHPAAYWMLNEQNFTILNVNDEVSYMLDSNPDVKEIYLVDNMRKVRDAYRDTIRDCKRPIESRVAFRDMLNHYGIKLL